MKESLLHNRTMHPPTAVEKMLAFLQRDVAIQTSYRLAFLLNFAKVFFSAFVWYFISQVIGTSTSPYISEYGGNYFAFVLIGIAFYGYFDTGLRSFAENIREAQVSGTLEAMLLTPTRLFLIVLSSTLWDYTLNTLHVLVYGLLGIVMFGLQLGNANYLVAVPVLVLTVICFGSLGIVAAAFIMVLKRGEPVAWVFSLLIAIVGGVYYPLEVLPTWLQIVGKFTPMTYALHAMRLALLLGASLNDLLGDIIALLVFCLILVPVALYVFSMSVDIARRQGTLAHF